MPAPQLLEIESPAEGRRFFALLPSKVLLGNTADCDLLLAELGDLECRMVLLRHDGDRLRLLTMSPGRFAWDDGQALRSESWPKVGDVLCCGDLRIRFLGGEASQNLGSTLSFESVRTTKKRDDLSLRDSDGRRMRIRQEGLSLGKDESCSWVLQDPFVSSFHLQLFWRDNTLWLRDLDSRNGTSVNGVRVMEAALKGNDQISIGRLNFRIEEHKNCVDEIEYIGKSEAAIRVRKSCLRFAEHQTTVLLQGETGTGKEVVAQMLHREGPRRDKPFVPLNCGALSESLIESELFGHEAGAFTGASRLRVGAFEAADGGTLFLDEIGELPLSLQPKLLRALESGEIRRLGSKEIRHVNVRVIAATNRRVLDEVKAGRFREDLYHRLSVLVLDLPSLRERTRDIGELVRFWLDRLGGEDVTISPSGIDKLMSHGWPGNVRELRNCLHRALVFCDGPTIEAGDLEFLPNAAGEGSSAEPSLASTEVMSIAEAERNAIVRALREFSGLRLEASLALGIARSTLQRKLGEYGISESDYR